MYIFFDLVILFLKIKLFEYVYKDIYKYVYCSIVYSIVKY